MTGLPSSIVKKVDPDKVPPMTLNVTRYVGFSVFMTVPSCAHLANSVIS